MPFLFNYYGLIKRLTGIVLFLFISVPGFTQGKKTYNLVRDFGAVPDNKTDNYNAFQKAAATLSRAGGGTLVIPAGKYYIGAYKIGGGPKANTVSDIVYRNCKGLTILGNGSQLRINGNFTRGTDYKLPGLDFNYAYNNSVAPFVFTNCSDVLLKDISIDGGVLQMKKGGAVVEGENYGIVIGDEKPTDVSSRILIKNVWVHHFAADGFLIRSNGERIAISHSRSTNNARQGLSIVKGKSITCEYSDFDSTGFTGVYGWHAPGAGIDVENEFGSGDVSNVLVKNCNIRSNKGFQVVTTLHSDKVVIDSSFIADLSYGYGDGLNGLGMFSLNSLLSNSILFATIQVDLADQIYKGPAVQQFINNIVYSGHRAITSASFERPALFTGNILVMLPKPELDQYFPYIQNSNCRFNNNVVVLHADRVVQTNQVTGLLQNTAEASNNFWLLNGYGTNYKESMKHWYYPALNGTKKVGKQYFSENHLPASKYGFEKLLSRQMGEKILGYGLFKAYQQKSFNKKYLLEANNVRKLIKSML